VWRLEGPCLGLRLRGPAPSAVAVGAVVASIIRHAPSTFDLVIDSRDVRLSHDGEQTTDVHRLVDGLLGALRERMSRYVMIGPRDWSTPWWHGVHVFAALQCPWRIMSGDEEAWEWLGLSTSQRTGLTELAASAVTQGPITREVEALVAVLLDADVELTARRLGMSVRSLQRALGQEGQTFHAVRTRRRLIAACDLLRRGEKVEAVAREVGFASTSHFATWFRQQSGALPSDFRRTGASMFTR